MQTVAVGNIQLKRYLRHNSVDYNRDKNSLETEEAETPKKIIVQRGGSAKISGSYISNENACMPQKLRSALEHFISLVVL